MAFSTGSASVRQDEHPSRQGTKTYGSTGRPVQKRQRKKIKPRTLLNKSNPERDDTRHFTTPNQTVSYGSPGTPGQARLRKAENSA